MIAIMVSCSSSINLLTFILLMLFREGISSGTTFTLTNNCDYVVWPGILSGASSPMLGSTGFELKPGGSQQVQAQPGWSGRFWGRTGCIFDPNTGKGNCTSGHCDSGQVECNGAGAAPPATLAEFTIGSGALPDFYDVSLVDGYNLPMMVEATGGTGDCAWTGCTTDLNSKCPPELRARLGDGCRSACEAFQTPEFCCRGDYGSPETCPLSDYSKMFKSACPRAYSYAYDDRTSTFTCTGADYTITFCPANFSPSSSPSQSQSQSSSLCQKSPHDMPTMSGAAGTPPLGGFTLEAFACSASPSDSTLLIVSIAISFLLLTFTTT